nr:DUF2760 domain-containing protein [Desulfobotulus pelophilus]
MDDLRPVLPHAGAFAGVICAVIFRGLCTLALRNQAAQSSVSISAKTASAVKTGSPQKAERAEDAGQKKARDERTFLYLMSALQKEARLLDFFAEDLDLYEDDQIGAAVRPVHEGARKVLARYLDLGVVMEDEEGSRVTIPKGFDPSRIKLVGRVAGDPPFQGTIRHRGWRAKGIRMPVFSDGRGEDVLMPSEVEIV